MDILSRAGISFFVTVYKKVSFIYISSLIYGMIIKLSGTVLWKGAIFL